MDSMISAAARALARGDILGALNRVSLREDPAALALRGLAMAQMGNLSRARELLRKGAKGFERDDPVAAARCDVAEAEIALVSRDLSALGGRLARARAVLESRGDRLNAVHATHLEARRYLLLGQIDEAEAALRSIARDGLPPAWRAMHAHISAGIWLRRTRTRPAREALEEAELAAKQAGLPSLMSEIEQSATILREPAARLVIGGGQRSVRLDEVEVLLDSPVIVVDALRRAVRFQSNTIDMRTRPILFALARTLAEASPRDVPRRELLEKVFRARTIDESHRARLRVEIARLRAALTPIAAIQATSRGFVLRARTDAQIAVLAPLIEGRHSDVLALLADGEAWSSSALALALGSSTRTVQRALEALAARHAVHATGRGPSKRWIAARAPGFPTVLLLPAASGVSR